MRDLLSNSIFKNSYLFCRMNFFNDKQDDWGEISEEFEEYADDWEYKLVTMEEQKQLLFHCGFRHVEAIEQTNEFVELLQSDLETLKTRKEEILEKYKEADLDNICSEWEEKIDHFIAGEQVWGYFTARKLFC